MASKYDFTPEQADLVLNYISTGEQKYYSVDRIFSKLETELKSKYTTQEIIRFLLEEDIVRAINPHNDPVFYVEHTRQKPFLARKNYEIFWKKRKKIPN